MGKEVSDVSIVHRMRTYLIGIPATPNTESIMNKWKDRLAVYLPGGAVDAEAEVKKLFPFIVSWELSENDVEFTAQEDSGGTSTSDPSGILTIASGLGFNPPISSHELQRWRIGSTGAGGNTKLTIFLSDTTVEWDSKGVL